VATAWVLGELMDTKTYMDWSGVDTRSETDAADPKTLRTATNVDLNTDLGLTERPGLRLVAVVDASSVGLYSVGGSLRAAMAAGHSKPFSVQGTVPILYDFVGDGSVYTLASVTKVTSVSSWDADSAQGIYPVIVIQRNTGRHEIHWIKDLPVSAVDATPPPAYEPSTDPVSTKLTLPFTPGPTILKIQEKMCAVDNTNGAVWFCATVDRPSSTSAALLYALEDWTTEGDAGFLPVLRHCTGDRTIQGLSFYDDLMAVLFRDSIQLWQMSASPAQMSLVRVLRGPGVQSPGSVANARGDLIYFSSGVFSSLRRSAVNGQLTDGDIGAAIAPETKPLASQETLALWSQGRSAYYCFFAGQGVAWRYMTSPTSKTKGWTKYELPAGITTDAVVEHLGELYLRSGVNVYRFENGYADGSTYTVDTQFLTLGTPDEMKFVNSMNFTGAGSPTVSCFYDMNSPDSRETLCTLEGSTGSMVTVMVLENSVAPGFRLSGAVGSGFVLDKLSFKSTVEDTEE